MAPEGQPPAPREWLLLELRRWAPALRIGASCAVAWVLTVAAVAARPRAGVLERVAAALALLAGLLAPILARRRPRLGRQLGLTGFVGLSLAAWLLASVRGGLPTLPGPRAWLGAIAWGLVALAWGAAAPASGAERARPSVEPGPRLEPRRPASRPAIAVSLLGALLAACCLGLAWIPGTSPRAVLVQTVAIAAALGLLGVAATLALLAGRLPEHEPGARGQGWRVLRASARSLLLALLLAAVAAALLLWPG